jgi:hypothetical protein
MSKLIKFRSCPWSKIGDFLHEGDQPSVMRVRIILARYATIRRFDTGT